MIYKLKYSDKNTAVKDLQEKGVIQKGSLLFGEGTHAVVFIGKIVLEEAVYEDEEMVVSPVYENGYFIDVMSDKVIDFDSVVYPEKVAHKFAGND
tara:strand:- start:7238 stop:7522 length:285 start_codon:yes stop_codon:yes gene_type:complete